jgi:hypothetical protein
MLELQEQYTAFSLGGIWRMAALRGRHSAGGLTRMEGPGRLPSMTSLAVYAGGRAPWWTRLGREGPFRQMGVGRGITQLWAGVVQAGFTPSYGRPTLFRVHDNLFCLAANHE